MGEKHIAQDGKSWDFPQLLLFKLKMKRLFARGKKYKANCHRKHIKPLLVLSLSVLWA